jgi:hypothetical protein
VANLLRWEGHLNYTGTFTLEKGLISVANVEKLFFSMPTLLVTAEIILEKIL